MHCILKWPKKKLLLAATYINYSICVYLYLSYYIKVLIIFLVQFLNSGFSVVGWYKRGIINDQSLIAARYLVSNGNNQASSHNNTNEELQVDAGEISYRFVHILPSNCDFWNPFTNLGQQLKEIQHYSNWCYAKHACLD